MKSQSHVKGKDKSFAALRSLIWQHKGRFVLVDIIRIASSVSIAFQPYFFAQLATSVNDKERAFAYLLAMLFTGFFHWATWHFADYLSVLLISPLFYEFKKITFTMFWKKKYPTFIEKPSGKVGHYINQFRNQLYMLYDAYEFGFLPILASIPVYMFLFYRSAWQTSIIYAVFLIVSTIILVGLTKPLTRTQRVLTDEESTNSGRVFDSYANFVNVFSFRAHNKEVTQNNIQVDGVIARDIKANVRIMNYWTAASTMIRVVLWSAILLYSWHLYDTGKISFEALIISVTVLVEFTNQYWNVVHQIGSWKRYTSTFREAYTYLFPRQNVVKEFYAQGGTFTQPSLSLSSQLEIRNLTFAYPDAPDQSVLKDINITVRKNEKIGIVGKSGSGKSTLIKILLGFYELDEGEIRVDGEVVDNEELSQLYAYVPQDTTLFQESIYYNIAYAQKKDVSLDDVKDAATKAHISEFIDSLPDGYDTLVGERGVKLSLGQRQRIAIARAFIKQSDLLILDEATSSLDSRTESYVQESFEQLWGNKSVIAIAHRLSTLNNVDRIIVMSKGEIVEEGTKDELLALDGHFADLWNHQRKGMI